MNLDRIEIFKYILGELRGYCRQNLWMKFRATCGNVRGKNGLVIPSSHAREMAALNRSSSPSLASFTVIHFIGGESEQALPEEAKSRSR